MRAVASFDIDTFAGEPPYLEEAGIQHSRVKIEKTFRGDIDAHSSVEVLGARAPDGAGYVALERITGTVQGRSGGFSLVHIGTMVGEETWAKWPIVPGSGTDDLRGIRGEARVDIDAEGHHTLTLDYEID
jgi:hypothetical protein